VAAAEFSAEDAGQGPLPRGPHGLSRKTVAENQRRRLLAATVETVAERGYSATTIAQITALAGLSRRTFYEHFSNKEDCFENAHRVALERLREAILAEDATAGDWPAQVRAALGALLGLLSAEADLAKFFLVDSLRAGDRIAERHRDAMQELVGLLVSGAPALPGPAEASRTREQTLAGGLSGLIARKVSAGDAASLPELLPALTELLLRPYLGAEQALRLAGSADSAE
jgi:AcrR family transcriptional regulator